MKRALCWLLGHRWVNTPHSDPWDVEIRVEGDRLVQTVTGKYLSNCARCAKAQP